MYSPAAIDNDPAIKAAYPAKRMMLVLAVSALQPETPITKQKLDTNPSFIPKTAALIPPLFFLLKGS